jgi:hypothetical protein
MGRLLEALTWRRSRTADDVASELPSVTEEDRRYLSEGYDSTVALTAEARQYLRSDNPLLVELRRAYAALDLPACERSRWSEGAVQRFLNLEYFRGETLITWHYRETRPVTELKYFAWLRYLEDVDALGLLGRLVEDGEFGCWTFRYPDRPVVSRDLLQSVNEINFLDRSLGIRDRTGLSVVDIGAGYGRLGHRMTAAFDHVTDYCCLDAIAESTFVCDYYLRHRGCAPPARSIPLQRLGELDSSRFDLAINIHSFSECTLRAVDWWVGWLAERRVRHLLLVPNDGDRLLTLESDGRRENFAPVLEAAGYHLTQREYVCRDAATRKLIGIEDQFHLFELAEG